MATSKLTIRRSTLTDLPRLLEVTARARAFMAETGNPTQWRDGYPTEAVLREDIALGRGYVCETKEGRVVGSFCFALGEDPTYREITGAWLSDEPYGTIHRLASSGEVGGIARLVFGWCFEQIPNIRVDTHADNQVMQSLLTHLGFVVCGTIIAGDGYPRIAYQRLLRGG